MEKHPFLKGAFSLIVLFILLVFIVDVFVLIVVFVLIFILVIVLIFILILVSVLVVHKNSPPLSKIVLTEREGLFLSFFALNFLF